MPQNLAVGMILGLALMAPRFIRGEQFGQQNRTPIILLVCDLVGIDAGIHLPAKGQVLRILRDAGVDVGWRDADSRSGSCPTGTPGSQFTVLILPRSPAAWTSDGLGLAPVRPGPHPRAYVFYDRVQAFVRRFESENQKMPVGVILGHAIAHELGHLLIPGDLHGSGIMSANWTSAEWRDAMKGRLLFNRDQVRQIQEALRAK